MRSQRQQQSVLQHFQLIQHMPSSETAVFFPVRIHSIQEENHSIIKTVISKEIQTTYSVILLLYLTAANYVFTATVTRHIQVT